MNILDQRCSNHALREAAVQCPSCKRFFCRECVTEHNGRMICVACVTLPAATQLRGKFQTRWTILSAAGILLAWLIFYYLGQTLAKIPNEFHAPALSTRLVVGPAIPGCSRLQAALL